MSGDANNTGTSLNSVDGLPGPLASGGGSVFGSTPAEKKAAANTIETELEPNTKKATDGAKEKTSAAARTLDGWETASGLKKVTETWDQQAKMLMGRLSAEKASLRGTSGLFVQNDVRTGDDLRALAPKSKLERL
ncbi:hypothetical protein AB0953_30890 [Streptomyces sp. NPDC046866]|uniref:hypothetical protein n=1 Tax=Streptomyces sp. NPDC046866 TaxID=3154921 RepID=UPI0034536E07